MSVGSANVIVVGWPTLPQPTSREDILDLAVVSVLKKLSKWVELMKGMVIPQTVGGLQHIVLGRE
jgi:hypothetical protein